MSEFDRVQETTSFQSVETLKQQLHTLGIQAGDSIMVHSSIKSMGWIAGGAKAVIDALMETITPEGTIVMAAQRQRTQSLPIGCYHLFRKIGMNPFVNICLHTIHT